MRDLSSFILADAASGVILFLITWALVRRCAWKTKIGTAVAAWFCLACIETVYWGGGAIDFCIPRPTSPWLVPAHLTFGALWLILTAAGLTGRIGSRIGRGTAFVACALAIIGSVAAVQWPYESVMSNGCDYHLRNQWLALHWYARDNGGRLPPVPGTDWASLTRPYYTYRPDLLRCPADHSGGVTSYILTPQAAGKLLSKIDRNTVLLIENKPRHHQKAHALLADGEVIDVKP